MSTASPGQRRFLEEGEGKGIIWRLFEYHASFAGRDGGGLACRTRGGLD